MEKKYYKIGEFAKLAGVTQRTLRYYDKLNLFKPSYTANNDYRFYTKDDLLTLQKILFFKNLGFPLAEIKPLIVESGDKDELLQSMNLQLNLVNEQINYYQKMKEYLITSIRMINQQTFNMNNIIEIINLITRQEVVSEHYKNANNLNVRILLHDKYSTSKINWFSWILANINFKKINRLLEVGCGNGELWKRNTINLRNREIFLSDVSEGMIEDARKNLSDEYNFMCFDCRKIPFKRNFFDAVVACHVLFYVGNIEDSLKEITRVLKTDGILYATTYSKRHMKEINDLVKEFDDSISLSQFSLYERFGFENGESILSKYFRNIERFEYNDKLLVTNPKALIDYILSCHGNQNEKLSSKYTEFYEFINSKMKKTGFIEITKEACLFIARK